MELSVVPFPLKNNIFSMPFSHYHLCINYCLVSGFFSVCTAVQAEGFKILNEGDEVEYDVQDAQDGKVAAANVKVLKTSVTDEQREAFAERANARRVRF